jgi:hypothetical protein
LAVVGWPSAWSDAGRWRCPPLGRRCPDRVRTIGWAVTLNWGCPDGREVGHVRRRPATAGCPQEDWSAETVSRRVSGGRTLADAGGRPDCGHVRHATGEVLEVPTGRSRLGARADERLRRGDLLPPPIGRRTIVGGGVGQWVSVSGSRPSALAGRGSARRRVVPSRRANRSARVAAIEPASRIQRTHPVSGPDSTPCPFTRPY